MMARDRHQPLSPSRVAGFAGADCDVTKPDGDHIAFAEAIENVARCVAVTKRELTICRTAPLADSFLLSILALPM